MKTFLALSAVAALVASANYGPDFKADPRDAGAQSIDVSGYPPEQQRNYDMYAMKCSKCHPLARSVNARFAPQDGKRYMKRMIRRPNSGINEEQAGFIYEFLKYYSTNLGL